MTDEKKSQEGGPRSDGAHIVVPVETASIDGLVVELRELLDRIWTEIKTRDRAEPGNLERLGELGAAVHERLSAVGNEPRHRKMLVKNREDSRPSGLPGTPTFYAHVHAAESLLRFVADPAGANIDPEDTTIGQSFEMKIYSRRWGHRDTFHVSRIASGWSFHYMTTIATGPDGRVRGAPGTGLFELLDHECINYPADLPGYFEYLWNAAADGLDRAGVETELTCLAGWVSDCEAGSPMGIFRHFK